MIKREYSIIMMSFALFFARLFLCMPCFAEEGESQGQVLVNKYLESKDTQEKEEYLNSLEKLLVNIDEVKKWIRGSIHYNKVESGIHRKLAPVGERKGEYFLYVPSSYDPNKPWPAILAFHGVGGRGYGQIKAWLRESNHDDEFIIIAPTYGSGIWWKEEAEKLVRSVFKEVLENFHIDSNRIYLTGFSSGGHAVWYFAIRYPWLFAAINPNAGECPLPSLLSNLMHVPAYIVHGAKDTIIPVEAGRDAYKRLKKLDYPVKYEELPEQKHHFPMSKTKSIINWFRSKQRVTYPETFTFTTDSTKYANAYWIEITKFSKLVGHVYGKSRDVYGRLEKPDDLAATAIIKASVNADKNEIELITDGIKALRIYLDNNIIDMNKPLHVRINGKKVFSDKVNVSIRSILETASNRNRREALYSNFIDLSVN